MAVLKYTNDHECVKIEGDIAWVGITKYAQEALGDLVYVELPSDLEMIKSPVGEQGWIAKIKISDPAQLANLMDVAAYKKYLESL